MAILNKDYVDTALAPVKDIFEKYPDDNTAYLISSPLFQIHAYNIR